MDIPIMEEMIEACKKKQTPDETIVFAFGVGRMVPVPTDSRETRRGIKKAIAFIKKLDGFVGINPITFEHNLLLFDTLNNAKGGRNLLRNQNCSAGEIVPVLVKNEFLEQKKADNENV